MVPDSTVDLHCKAFPLLEFSKHKIPTRHYQRDTKQVVTLCPSGQNF